MSLFAWVVAVASRLGTTLTTCTICIACMILYAAFKHIASRTAYKAFQSSLLHGNALNLHTSKSCHSSAAADSAAGEAAATAAGAATFRNSNAINNNKVDATDVYVQRVAAHLNPGQHRVQLFALPKDHNSSTFSSSSASASTSEAVKVPDFPSLTLRDQYGDEGLVRVVSWNVERGV